MANTRLFDSWQIGMDLPAPFDRAIDGGVRYSTKEEDCSCYNKATRGKKATLFPVVLRAVLNLMRGGLNDGNIAAFYCMEYTKAYQGKEMDTQRKIASVLRNLDEIIELNSAINNNLEQQAQAIFSNEFLTLETLPDGWKQASLIGIADYLNGLAMQKYRTNADETGIPVLKIKELRQGCCDDNSELCSSRKLKHELNIKILYGDAED